MVWVLALLGAVGCVSSTVYWGLSLSELSPFGRQHGFRVLFAYVWADREHFTELGWRYRTRALVLSFVPGTAAVVYVLTS